jgi:hypothetical protein
MKIVEKRKPIDVINATTSHHAMVMAVAFIVQNILKCQDGKVIGVQNHHVHVNAIQVGLVQIVKHTWLPLNAKVLVIHTHYH